MLNDLFEELEAELQGIDSDEASIRVGTPHDLRVGIDDANGSKITVYLTFLNLESVDHYKNQARVRIMITTYYSDDNQEDEIPNEAIKILDEILELLADNKSKYSLVATPEHSANNIWSALRVGLRPFLVYECPVQLTQ